MDAPDGDYAIAERVVALQRTGQGYLVPLGQRSEQLEALDLAAAPSRVGQLWGDE